MLDLGKPLVNREWSRLKWVILLGGSSHDLDKWLTTVSLLSRVFCCYIYSKWLGSPLSTIHLPGVILQVECLKCLDGLELKKHLKIIQNLSILTTSAYFTETLRSIRKKNIEFCHIHPTFVEVGPSFSHLFLTSGCILAQAKHEVTTLQMSNVYLRAHTMAEIHLS